jgi:hypothetical protein
MDLLLPTLIIAILAALDLAALRFGTDTRDR